MKDNRYLVTHALVLVFGGLVLLAGCDNPAGGDPPGTGTGEEPTETAIQGTLPSESLASSMSSRSVAGPSISSALLFYGDTVVQKPVTEGSFYLPVSSDQPAGIVFVGPDDSYQGYVSIWDNSNVLPLQGLDDVPVLVDLGELSLPQASASGRGHKFGHSKNMSGYLPKVDADLLNSMAGASTLFSSVIENPDFDGNGTVDILEDKSIDAMLVYYTGALGSFGTDYVPTVTFDANNLHHKIVISTQFSHELTNATLLRPEQSIEDTPGTAYASFWFQLFAGVPTDGAYVFQADYNDGTAKTIDYTFRVPAGVSTIIENNLLIIQPTVDVVDGNLESVSWDVLYPDLTPVTNPELILTELEVQIDDASSRIYDSGWVPVSDGSHVIPDAIAWDDVDTVYMTYNDRFGNHYVNQYPR